MTGELEIGASDSHRTKAKKREACAARRVQSERRAFLSLNIDPVGECEFKGRPSCDALGHGYTRNSDCGGCVRWRFGLAIALAEPVLLPWNGPVKL